MVFKDLSSCLTILFLYFLALFADAAHESPHADRTGCSHLCAVRRPAAEPAATGAAEGRGWGAEERPGEGPCRQGTYHRCVVVFAYLLLNCVAYRFIGVMIVIVLEKLFNLLNPALIVCFVYADDQPAEEVSAPTVTQQFKLVTNPTTGYIDKVLVGLPEDLLSKLNTRTVAEPGREQRRREAAAKASRTRGGRTANDRYDPLDILDEDEEEGEVRFSLPRYPQVSSPGGGNGRSDLSKSRSVNLAGTNTSAIDGNLDEMRPLSLKLPTSPGRPALGSRSSSNRNTRNRYDNMDDDEEEKEHYELPVRQVVSSRDRDRERGRESNRDRGGESNTSRQSRDSNVMKNSRNSTGNNNRNRDSVETERDNERDERRENVSTGTGITSGLNLTTDFTRKKGRY